MVLLADNVQPLKFNVTVVIYKNKRPSTMQIISIMSSVHRLIFFSSSLIKFLVKWFIRPYILVCSFFLLLSSLAILPFQLNSLRVLVANEIIFAMFHTHSLHFYTVNAISEWNDFNCILHGFHSTQNPCTWLW